MSKVINKGLKEGDKKEGLLKRHKNIEEKIEEQLKTVKGKTHMKSQIDLFNEELSSEAVVFLKKLKRHRR